MIYFLPIIFAVAEFLTPLIEGKHLDYYHGSHTVVALLIAPLVKAWEERKTRMNLTALAERLGLHIQETGMILGIFAKMPTVEGRYRGRNVRFFNYYHNAVNRWKRKPLRMEPGEATTAKGVRWSAVGAAIAGNSEFILETETKRRAQLILETKLRQSNPNRVTPFKPRLITPGLETVATGDDAFDQAILVQSNDSARAKEILTAKIRAQFLEQPKRRFISQMTQVIIRDGEVRYAEWHSFSSKARVERIAAKLDFVCELAGNVEASRASSMIKNFNPSLTQKF